MKKYKNKKGNPVAIDYQYFLELKETFDNSLDYREIIFKAAEIMVLVAPHILAANFASQVGPKRRRLSFPKRKNRNR